MPLSKKTLSIQQRASEQLHTLSELSETLTLRLLDIEARVSSLEKDLDSNQIEGIDTSQELLSQSEERVQYLKNLLETEDIVDKHIHLVSPEPEKNVESNNGNSLKEDQNEKMYHHHLDETAEVTASSSDKTTSKEIRENTNLLETEYVDDDQSPFMTA